VHIGVVFPQTEIEPDAVAIGTYGRTVEQLGFRHLLAYDHVLGADPVVHAPWTRPYDVNTVFQELFVLFGYLAGITKLHLITGVLILPQRQTALVAKQAAQVDVLTGGRLRLGVGIGWNKVEYEALGKTFGDRARREEEQIELLRRLWTEPTVSFAGEFETITGAGLNPLPVSAGLPAHRTVCRRLDPRNAARRRIRRGACACRTGSTAIRTRPQHPGHGSPRPVDGRPRMVSGPGRAVANARCDASVSEHHEGRPRRGRRSSRGPRPSRR
jgi:probable F420-dependent oxidoreductase